jgi:hypothetical protein
MRHVLSEPAERRDWYLPVRPDAYDIWTDPSRPPDDGPASQPGRGQRGPGWRVARPVPFFVEYDTGTEPLTRLADKLSSYAQGAPVSRTPIAATRSPRRSC